MLPLSLRSALTLFRLAIAYNALPNDVFKDNFEAWAKEEFPHVWSDLDKKPRRRDAEGWRKFQISRPWKA
jgi:hypothetical protein